MEEPQGKSAKFETFAPSAEMKALLEHSDRSIIILDSSFRIMWFNSRAAQGMFTYSREELKSGYSYWDYVDRDHNKRFIRNFNAALKGRKISTEQKVPKPGTADQEIWVEGLFSPLHDKKGQITGVIYSYLNITDRKRAEKENFERDNILQAINHNDSQAFILLDEDDRILSCNLLAPSMLAIEANSIDPYGMNIVKCIHSDWKERFNSGLKLARAGGSASVEFEKPEEQGWTEIRFTPVKGRLGKEHMVAIWAFDITDKKLAERVVKQSEANLRAVFNSSSQSFYLLDRKLNIMAFNKASELLAAELYGKSVSVGLNAAEMMGDENSIQFKVEIERAFSGRKVVVEKFNLVNGKERWFEQHVDPVYNNHKEIDRVTIWSIDITERKKAEKALRENESKFRKLAALLPVGIYQVDSNGNPTYINESLQLIIGADMTSILSGKWTEQIHPSDRDNVRSTWRAVEKSQKPFSLEYRFKRMDGTDVFVLEQAQPLFDHLGEYKGYLGTIIDITEQKKTQQLIHEKSLAERSLRFRSSFLASMSHEIRTPLNGIMGLSEVLLDTDLSNEQRSKVGNILKASKDLREIVNDVLDLSKLEAGKVEVQNEDFALTELVNMVAERFGPEAELKNLKLEVKDTSGNLEIHSDRRRITQVLSNLVRNAIKFTKVGSVTIQVRPSDDGFIMLEVMDTGMGIPKADLQNLFKDFSQLAHTTAQDLEGTGLGLSICRKLVELMGGEIGVSSEVEKGSRFWFKVPLVEVEAKNVTAKPKSKTEPKKSKGDVSVLLVEDNLINQQAFKIMLQKMGCQVKVVSNGRQAVEQFEPNRFDIVFMDIQMPIMDGLQATAEIKKRFKAVPPVIGLSGNILQRDENGKLDSEMDDLLLKPVVSNELERMIRKWVA